MRLKNRGIAAKKLSQQSQKADALQYEKMLNINPNSQLKTCRAKKICLFEI